MARLSPLNLFVNTDGSPLASGTINTYITGTTTDKATYTDQAAGTEHNNPIVLGADGMAPGGQIWLDTDQEYTFLVKDSSGSTVATINNVRPIPNLSSLDQDLDVNGNSIISSSNQDITITPNGTGSIVLDGLSWPQADGTANQILKTDGAGNLGFATYSSDLVNDTSPQLAGNLDTQSYSISIGTSGKGFIDASSNELLLFTYSGSEVNYINIRNASSGLDPTISAAGDDANIDLAISPKGSGAVVISGLRYPTADGSANQVLTTNGFGTLSFSTASISTASQAQMEAASASNVAVTPAVTQNHPGVAKGWVAFQMDGTIVSSHNVDSITDNGTGDFTINWDTDFSSANYSVSGSLLMSSGDDTLIGFATKAAGSVQVLIVDSAGSATETNVSQAMVVAFGDQ